MIKKRLCELRRKMEEEGIDVYYFNTSDYHLSEYVPAYFKTIAYFTDFKGSMATFLVDRENSYLFVDGRYHLQADAESKIHGINIVKLGKEGALNPLSFIKENYADKVIGLDGKRTSVVFGKSLTDMGIKIISKDIYSDIITDRIPLSKDPVYKLDIEYTGKTRKKKLEDVLYCLNGRTHIINNLESIAYLLNLRSNDVLYTPVFMSFMVFNRDDVYLFADIERFSEDILMELYDDGVIVREYDAYYEFIDTLKKETVLLDESKVNFETYIRIKDRNSLFNMRSPVEDFKAVKNETEIKNIRLAHEKDGASMVRFLKWLKETDLRNYTEYEAGQKLKEIRLNGGAFDLSFGSIVGYKENAAVVHYSPDSANSKRLDNADLLLIDSGGQYKEGTTDITRTVALGEVSQKEKMYFTTVLKCMLNLSELRFPKGLCGSKIDPIVRNEIWSMGLDYMHGTGHGVGFVNSVHESPVSIRYSNGSNSPTEVELRPGHVFSDEPGLYLAGEFGIRCENLLLCREDIKNEYGQFYSFETLTLCPFDIELIDTAYLDKKHIVALNSYHKRVYETLCPYLNEEEQIFLKEITREIQ